MLDRTDLIFKTPLKWIYLFFILFALFLYWLVGYLNINANRNIKRDSEHHPNVQSIHSKAHGLETPTPYAFVLKDKNIIVPARVCPNIEMGSVSVHFNIDSSAQLIDFHIIGLKLISKSKNIDFVNEHFLVDTTKKLPFELQPFIPLIKAKLTDLKIKRNKYGKPKKINYGTVRLILVNENSKRN